MHPDPRTAAAEYYDLVPTHPDDLAFYRNLIRSPDFSVLELGCGTGRVLVPLAESCRYIHGIDHSQAMLDICQRKLTAAAIPRARAAAEVGDICSLHLNQRFDLIIAPFRVMQNLETDEQIAGLMRTIRDHLAPGGSAVLNAFNPMYTPRDMRRRWVWPAEVIFDEIELRDERSTRLVYAERRPRMDFEKLILYPELIYRRYHGPQLIHEVTLKIAMRCWYPLPFQKLIQRHGFKILHRWGGYTGERWTRGSELVIQFQHAPAARH